jgi:amino acid permease
MLFAYLSTLAIVEYDEWKLVKPDAHKIMMAFGIFMFGYDANGVLTEIRSEMKNIKDFKKCLFIAMVSETILFFIFGISSSLLF